MTCGFAGGEGFSSNSEGDSLGELDIELDGEGDRPTHSASSLPDGDDGGSAEPLDASRCKVC